MFESTPPPSIALDTRETVITATNGATNGVSQQAPEESFSWLKPHVQFVVVLVGPEKIAFAMHLDFLRTRSSYIKDRFKSVTACDLENIMELPDTTPEIFGYAQHFLFTGQVVPESHDVPSYETLIGLWRLGHTLSIEGLCEKTLDAMLQCRRVTSKIPATPLLVQVWKDTPEGSSIRKMLLSWAAEYMRTSDGAQEFAKSLPQEVLSELVVAMSIQASQPKIKSPETTPAPGLGAESPATNEPVSRKAVHYLDSGSDEDSRGKKIRRTPLGPSYASAPPVPERKAPTNRKFVKAAIPKRRSSGAPLMNDGEITDESKVDFCSGLLERMLSGPGFWTRLVGPFKDPVDPDKDHVPDYFEKVKTPMDLMTVKNKMDRQQYTTAEEFAADVRLIFSNCYTYWKRGDPMWVACERFEKTFEDKFGLMNKSIYKLMREPVE